jgi:hypothetical protein
MIAGWWALGIKHRPLQAPLKDANQECFKIEVTKQLGDL